jgi:hypothetical protein
VTLTGSERAFIDHEECRDMKQPLKETQDPKEYIHIYRVMGGLGADTKYKKKNAGEKKIRVAPGNRQSRRASSKSKKTSLPKAKGFGK